MPARLEHEYTRKGALNLFAGFDTRTGEVMGILRRRKRQVEFIELREEIDRATPVKITAIHLICDNVSVHHGKMVRACLEKHPPFSAALYARALLVDEPGGAVVFYSSAQAHGGTELPRPRRPRGENQSVYCRVERRRSSVQLDS